MSEPKYTPGPWRMPPCCTIHMNKPTCDERYSPLVKSGANVVCGLSDVRVADARLIAAAPEMYELLAAILGDLHFCRHESAISVDLEHRIEAVLAIARGENR